MAKVDWPKAIAKWEKDHAATGIKPKAWCEQNGLNHNSARRHIKIPDAQKCAQKCAPKVRKSAQKGSARKAAQDPNDQHVSDSYDDEIAQKPPKRRSLQRHGNQNAKIHGLFSKHFGDAWDIAGNFTPDVRTQVVNAQSIEALEARGRYKSDLDKLQSEIEERQREATEDEFDRLEKLADRIDSCNRTITRLMKMGSSLDLDEINMDYIRTSDEHKRVDMRLKEKNISLAEANTKKSKAQTDLGIAQLKALDKDEGGKKDDIDEMLDEILDNRDGLMSEMPEFDEDV